MTTANSCLVRDHVSLTGMRIETIGIEAGWNRDRDRTETQQVLSHHRALASHPLFTGVLGQCESGGGERINIHRGMDERPDLIYLSIILTCVLPPNPASSPLTLPTRPTNHLRSSTHWTPAWPSVSLEGDSLSVRSPPTIL